MSRGTRQLTKLIALLSVLMLVFAACGDDDDTESTNTDDTEQTGGDKQEATIAYVGPLTGEAANLGLNIRDGIKLAVDQHNKKDDAKYTITLKEFDTKGDPAVATTVKDQFVNDDDIIGIVGPAFSGETKAVLPSLQEAGLVMISASATNKDLPTVVPNATVFHRVIADDTFQGKGIGKFIADEFKDKKVVVVHDNSEYGKGLADDVTAAVGTAVTGGAVVIDPKAQDYSAAVNTVKSRNPDVLFFGGYYQAAGLLKKQLTDGGVKSTFISGDGSLDPGFVTAAGNAAAEGSLLSCPCNLATEDAAGDVGQFAKDYKALIGKDPGTYSTEAYDAANILIDGIEAGNTTRENLVKYVEEEVGTYDGISKSIEFEENGNVKNTEVFTFEVKNGKIGTRD